MGHSVWAWRVGRATRARMGDIRRRGLMCLQTSRGADSPLSWSSTPQIPVSDAGQVSRASLRVLTG